MEDGTNHSSDSWERWHHQSCRNKDCYRNHSTSLYSNLSSTDTVNDGRSRLDAQHASVEGSTVGRHQDLPRWPVCWEQHHLAAHCVDSNTYEVVSRVTEDHHRAAARWNRTYFRQKTYVSLTRHLSSKIVISSTRCTKFTKEINIFYNFE